MKTPAAERFRAMARSVAEVVRHDHPDVLGIYAYGSVGRGDATPASDLDLHVVLPYRRDLPDRTIEHEGIVVDISYHSSRWYETNLMELLTHESGLNQLAGAESLWEVADAFIPYDPKGLVARFADMAAKVRQHPEVIRRRAALTVQEGFAVLREAERELARNAPASCVNLLYRLTGGTGRSGVLPLGLRALVQLGSQPLSTRRLFLSARAAAKCLGFDLTDFMAAYGCRLAKAPLQGSQMMATLLYLFDVSRQQFENPALPTTPMHAQAQVAFTDLQRERLAASVAELYNEDPVACTVFAAGIGQVLLA